MMHLNKRYVLRESETGVEVVFDNELKTMMVNGKEQSVEPILKEMKEAERRGELRVEDYTSLALLSYVQCGYFTQYRLDDLINETFHDTLKMVAEDYQITGMANDRAGIESMLSIKIKGRKLIK